MAVVSQVVILRVTKSTEMCRSRCCSTRQSRQTFVLVSTLTSIITPLCAHANKRTFMTSSRRFLWCVLFTLTFAIFSTGFRDSRRRARRHIIGRSEATRRHCQSIGEWRNISKSVRDKRIVRYALHVCCYWTRQHRHWMRSQRRSCKKRSMPPAQAVHALSSRIVSPPS